MCCLREIEFKTCQQHFRQLKIRVKSLKTKHRDLKDRRSRSWKKFEWRKNPNTVTYGLAIHGLFTTSPGDFRQTTWERPSTVFSAYSLLSTAKIATISDNLDLGNFYFVGQLYSTNLSVLEYLSETTGRLMDH